MITRELLKKLHKLDYIYDLIDVEIEAYDIEINLNIINNWGKRKSKLQLELINQFKKEACLDIASKAWLQALKKANEPMTEKGFKAWYNEYMKNN